jgi:hypothetical protein
MGCGNRVQEASGMPRQVFWWKLSLEPVQVVLEWNWGQLWL